MAESDSSVYSTASASDSSVYSTATEREQSSGIEASDSEDLIEQSSVVQAYSNEPLASESDERSSDETDDEDGIPSATIAGRFDGIVPVDSW